MAASSKLSSISSSPASRCIFFVSFSLSKFPLLVFPGLRRKYGPELVSGHFFQNPTQNFWTQPNPSSTLGMVY